MVKITRGAAEHYRGEASEAYMGQGVRVTRTQKATRLCSISPRGWVSTKW